MLVTGPASYTTDYGPDRAQKKKKSEPVNKKYIYLPVYIGPCRKKTAPLVVITPSGCTQDLGHSFFPIRTSCPVNNICLHCRRGDPAECSNSRPATSSCKDHRRSKYFCEYYKSRNKCNIYKPYFKKKCKKTCGFC